MDAPDFSADELEGFEKATLSLPAEDDGDLVATLVRTVGDAEDPRAAVLYLHGFVDYFFQAHVARAFEEAGFRFYALDLRRHGRSLREGNRPCWARSVEDYFTELDWAFGVISQSHPKVAALVAHSTGGLVASLYLDSKTEPKPTECLVLNSPFLRFNLSKKDRALSWLVARAGRFAPSYRLPQTMNTVYGKTLHVSHGGEWNYDLSKKPIEGFPLYAGWFRLIREGHARVARGLNVGVPVLSLCSDSSAVPGDEPSDRDRRADIVLNVEHIRALSPRLGSRVTLFEIPGGVHDLTLSQKPARDLATQKMVDFVREISRHP